MRRFAYCARKLLSSSRMRSNPRLEARSDDNLALVKNTCGTTPISAHCNAVQCSEVSVMKERSGEGRWEKRTREREKKREKREKKRESRAAKLRHDTTDWDGMGWVDGWSGSLRDIGFDWLRFDWNELSSSTYVYIIRYCKRKYCGSVQYVHEWYSSGNK